MPIYNWFDSTQWETLPIGGFEGPLHIPVGGVGDIGGMGVNIKMV